MLLVCKEGCCEASKVEQEVGVSATAILARFADPRLHVISPCKLPSK